MHTQTRASSCCCATPLTAHLLIGRPWKSPRGSQLQQRWWQYAEKSSRARTGWGTLPPMPIILILVILLLLFGGGGYYMGPGVGYYGGGGLSLVLIIVILYLLFGRRRGGL